MMIFFSSPIFQRDGFRVFRPPVTALLLTHLPTFPKGIFAGFDEEKIIFFPSPFFISDFSSLASPCILNKYSFFPFFFVIPFPG